MMDGKDIIGILLIIIILMALMPYEKRYSKALNSLAQNPATRFIASILVLYLTAYNTVLGALGFIVLFLWVSDIHLLSSLKLKDQTAN
jgi:hypothetical protein